MDERVPTPSPRHLSVPQWLEQTLEWIARVHTRPGPIGRKRVRRGRSCGRAIALDELPRKRRPDPRKLGSIFDGGGGNLSIMGYHFLVQDFWKIFPIFL